MNGCLHYKRTTNGISYAEMNLFHSDLISDKMHTCSRAKMADADHIERFLLGP